MATKDFLSLMWRRALFLIAGLIIGVALGFVVSRVQTPVYEAKTDVLVSRAHQPSNTDLLTLSDEQLVSTNVRLLQSQPVLSAASSLLGSKIKADNIQVSVVPNTLIIHIKVQDTNAQRAAAIANVLVQSLAQENENLVADRYTTLESRLNTQIDQIQKQINDLQGQITQIDDANISDQLTQVNQEIGQLKSEISSLQNEINSYPSFLDNIQRASLSEKQAQLDQLGSLLNLYQQMQANLTFLGRPGQTSLTRDNPRLTSLQSTLNLYQQIYLSLVNSRENVNMNRMQDTPSISQIDPAVLPKAPIRPLPPLYILLGGVVGLVLSVASILIIDSFDDTLKTPNPTEELLGIPVLGSVIENHAEGGVVALQAPFSIGANAFRALGASIEIVGAEKSIRTLMIVNAGPKDDKTNIAANLAIVNAQQGKRVILIDGDIHNPHLHSLFGFENQEGLAEIFGDKLNIKGACHAVSDIEGMMLIPGGVPEKDSTEWLDAKKLAQLLLELQKQSDLVILDGPSAELADAQVFASKMDAVLLAIYPGYTHIHSVQDSLRKFQLIGANVLGAVLNRNVRSRINLKNILHWAKIRLHKEDVSQAINSETKDAPVSLS